ncbi:hypothetical protein RugamoR64_15400 [Duganella rhizosphaerae]|uniref:integrase arm-type DNA-binding domain-containing protein n=1 Tax=Duganella rhizosphaerae TaxID=2885763 RepID=UPI0030E9B6CF
MALTATFVKALKLTKGTTDQCKDGEGMYLLVNSASKYWRMDYRFLDRRETLALRVYRQTTVAKARQKRADAELQLAEGVDPGAAKRLKKLPRSEFANQTFESVARTWLKRPRPAAQTATRKKSPAGWKATHFPASGD